MKFISYIIILAVMSVIGWTTDNSLDSIFPQRANNPAKIEALAKITERPTLTSRLENLLGE